jgi:hypothetical protein
MEEEERCESDSKSIKIMIIRYFASKQKRQEYNWCQIDIWAFRSFLPTGRQASSVSISKENKATGAIADIHNKNFQTP